MRFISSSQTWSRGISAVHSAVGSPISTPVVENIHISCEQEQVQFMATNLNLTIRCEGEARVEEPGQIMLPAKYIEGIVRDLPKDDVSFEVEGESVRLVCGKYKVRMKAQSGDIFPEFNSVETDDVIVIDVQLLKDFIRKTIFSTSSEKSRYELDGIKFDIREKKLTCVATDGRRLAYCNWENENITDREISALVPTKTMQELPNVLPDSGDVQIHIQDRRIQFSSGDVKVISNLLNDNFPDYSA